jgi:hypothetical protein
MLSTHGAKPHPAIAPIRFAPLRMLKALTICSNQGDHKWPLK